MIDPIAHWLRKPRTGALLREKHATAGAARATVAQIRGDRRADFRRQGKGGSLTAFPSDAHLSGLPVNIVELEKGHFTGTQPESREQEHDRVVAPAGRGAPIDTGQQLTDLVRPNRARDRWHRPVGDDGNGGGQIQRHRSAIARVPQEGPQRAGQELRALQMQTWRLAPDKAHDIAGTQARRARPVRGRSDR